MLWSGRIDETSDLPRVDGNVRCRRRQGRPHVGVIRYIGIGFHGIDFCLVGGAHEARDRPGGLRVKQAVAQRQISMLGFVDDTDLDVVGVDDNAAVCVRHHVEQQVLVGPAVHD